MFSIPWVEMVNPRGRPALKFSSSICSSCMPRAAAPLCVSKSSSNSIESDRVKRDATRLKALKTSSRIYGTSAAGRYVVKSQPISGWCIISTPNSS